LADALPPQRGNPALEREERIRDMLVSLGFQEVITYRLTSPENEARRFPPDSTVNEPPYVRILNPSAPDRSVLRHSILASLLDILERNARLRDRHAIFEIGEVFFPTEEARLPREPLMLGIALTGPRNLPGWQEADTTPMDFYDLKGVLTALLEGLQIRDFYYEAGEHPSFHPGTCARVMVDGQSIGVIGEIHPQVQEQYELPDTPVLAAEFDLDAILPYIPERYDITPVPAYPPILEDLAVIVDEDLPAARVAQVIQAAGGETVTAIKLFDVYQGRQIGPGKKSLAYSITYQEPGRTLTDEEVSRIRQRIIESLEKELGAKVRSE
jgi:phenylalanyl-tRNA synthetase beta chain